MHFESAAIPVRSLPQSLVEATGSPASTEVVAKATRRRFTLAYKRRIVTLTTGLSASEMGALRRREGLYSSHLTHSHQLIAAPSSPATPCANATLAATSVTGINRIASQGILCRVHASDDKLLTT